MILKWLYDFQNKDLYKIFWKYKYMNQSSFNLIYDIKDGKIKNCDFMSQYEVRRSY